MDASVPADPVLRDEPRQTVLVPLDRIEFGDRLRSVNQPAVAHIAESIRRHGLQNPVQVRPIGDDRYGLIAGAHRCQAMRALGQDKVEAFVLDHLDADQMDLLEIDENLMRSELHPLDRGRFLFRRKRIHERLYPATRHGGDRKSAEFKAGERPKSFVAETASFTPFSAWTIRRALRIGEKILPELQDELAETALAWREGDLYRISGMDEPEQTRVLEALRDAEEQPRTLSQLMRGHGDEDEPPEEIPTGEPGPDAGEENTVLQRLQMLWIEANEEEQEQFIAWFELIKAERDAGQPSHD
ncbi:MAG: ParB N-terminal domain-containing protein [Alphaproteobacteria bacterium]|nr:ParB N-terminal domain-containing protein [Alphaproteobacteria bacterium]